MTTMTFDKLADFDRLKAAGFAEAQARVMTDGLDQALREDVATKEIHLLRDEIKTDLMAFRSDLLAAMKANKIDLLQWFIILIAGQTVFLTALKLLDH